VAANEPGQPSLRRARDLTRDLPSPAVALAIGAHPDDVEFGCGGTLAKWAADGCAVHHLVCTDGSKGTWDPHADISALITARRAEQRAAAATLGARGSVTFLGVVDGELEASVPLRARVVEVIRRVRPEVVLGHDPWKRYRLHPDHRAAGFLVCDAIVAARDPFFFPEQDLTPHRPSTLLLWEADEVNHVEDISSSIDAKLAAIEAHASQFESTMGALDEAGLEAFRGRMRSRLAEHGALVGVAAAEVFAAIRDL
jgi:LmbE family N-acetylglucosaminyl deacetylase